MLFGPTACHNETRLRQLLRTDWRIVVVPSEADLALLLAELPHADALISLGWQSEWAAAAAKLKLIQALGAGTDAFDLAGLPAGCALCNVYEHGAPVAEYVIGAMVALTVRFTFHDRQLRQGLWDGTGRRDGASHAEMAGRTVGLIGWGNIGRAMANRARAFEMRIHAIRAHPQAAAGEIEPDWLGGPEQLRDLLAASDYLVVCCPLTARTREMLNRETLGWLKPEAYLINVARAEIIEEEALFDALKNNRLAGAALDVWYHYPATIEQRLLPSKLPFHELENVLMTPHLSAWTEAMIERRWGKIAANLDALAEGQPLQNLVCAAAEQLS